MLSLIFVIGIAISNLIFLHGIML